MRIATAYAFDSSLGNLQRRQQALSDAQQQLTSGKRVQLASDDPTAAAQAARAMAAETRLAAQQRALAASQANLQLTESALGEAGELMQQARELVLSAGNGSYTAADRVTIARQLQGVRDDLLATANRRDADGRYLFGGRSSAGAAFVEVPSGAEIVPGIRSPGVVSYNALDEYQVAAADADHEMPLTLDGSAVWMDGTDPLPPGGAMTVFEALDRSIAALADPAAQDAAAIARAVAQGVSRIDAAAEGLAAWRSSTGESLNGADRLEAQLGEFALDAQTQRSEAEDLDMLEAISDFQNRQTGYDAALKTYSIVQRMSLFDYVK
jgi:flagellar hook-associated protein 3 FlgL